MRVEYIKAHLIFDLGEEIFLPSKTRYAKLDNIAFKRHVFMYLMRTQLNLTWNGIGAMLSNRDHTTVMYGVRKIEDLLINEHLDGIQKTRRSFVRVMELKVQGWLRDFDGVNIEKIITQFNNCPQF